MISQEISECERSVPSGFRPGVGVACEQFGEMRARDDHNSVIEEIDFECLSIAGALDKAKAMVKAGHADLYEDGMPICSMELVVETGVWLVGKPR